MPHVVRPLPLILVVVLVDDGALACAQGGGVGLGQAGRTACVCQGTDACNRSKVSPLLEGTQRWESAQARARSTAPCLLNPLTLALVVAPLALVALARGPVHRVVRPLFLRLRFLALCCALHEGTRSLHNNSMHQAGEGEQLAWWQRCIRALACKLACKRHARAWQQRHGHACVLQASVASSRTHAHTHKAGMQVRMYARPPAHLDIRRLPQLRIPWPPLVVPRGGSGDVGWHGVWVPPPHRLRLATRACRQTCAEGALAGPPAAVAAAVAVAGILSSQQ